MHEQNVVPINSLAELAQHPSLIWWYTEENHYPALQQLAKDHAIVRMMGEVVGSHEFINQKVELDLLEGGTICATLIGSNEFHILWPNVQVSIRNTPYVTQFWFEDEYSYDQKSMSISPIYEILDTIGVLFSGMRTVKLHGRTRGNLFSDEIRSAVSIGHGTSIMTSPSGQPYLVSEPENQATIDVTMRKIS